MIRRGATVKIFQDKVLIGWRPETAYAVYLKKALIRDTSF